MAQKSGIEHQLSWAQLSYPSLLSCLTVGNSPDLCVCLSSRQLKYLLRLCSKVLQLNATKKWPYLFQRDISRGSVPEHYLIICCILQEREKKQHLRLLIWLHPLAFHKKDVTIRTSAGNHTVEKMSLPCIRKESDTPWPRGDREVPCDHWSPRFGQ